MNDVDVLQGQLVFVKKIFLLFESTILQQEGSFQPLQSDLLKEKRFEYISTQPAYVSLGTMSSWIEWEYKLLESNSLSVV